MAINFRKKSLEKLSSPEELDTLLTITSPGIWAAIITIGFCLVVALVWGFFGRIPNKLTGSGLLLNAEGIFSVRALSGGSVKKINAALGQRISKGEILVELNYPEHEALVADARTELAALERQYRNQQADEKEMLSRKELEKELTIQEITMNIKSNRARAARLEERIENQKALLAQGLITAYDLDETIAARDKARDAVLSDSNRESATRDTYEQARIESKQRLENLEDQVRRAHEELREKEVQLKADEIIASPYDGIVVGIATKRGALISAGSEILTLDLIRDTTARKTLICRQYYPAGTAKRIKVGMMTQVAPGTVAVDQYGYLLAEVTSVAAFPASTAELQSQLQNDEMVREITRMGPVLAVESAPVGDPATPSGYRWTSSNGPPYELDNGTPCDTSVVIEELPPVTLVIPALKKVLLGIGEERP